MDGITHIIINMKERIKVLRLCGNENNTRKHTIKATTCTITSCFFFRRFERYARAVAKTHESVHTTPFDVVTPNIVFGLDVINLVNFSGISVPKYNNFVMKKEMFDKKTKINLQKFLFDDAVSYR